MGMIRFSWLALVALLASFVLFGCGTTEEDEYGNDDRNVSTDIDEADENGDDESDDSEGDDEASSLDVPMTLASNAYTNDDGVPICPVMGAEVKYIAALASHEYEGKTYYFC